MTQIRTVRGRQLFDSRGRPTVEVEVGLTNGVTARASVPSGASTGSNEAHELRDGDSRRFRGLGVLGAVAHVNDEIAAVLRGRDVDDQAGCDSALRELDGTSTLSRLGANAVLGTSLAVCRASALAAGKPLYRRIAELTGAVETGDVVEPSLPMPMVNILSGGLHAGRGMDVQDFLAIPVGATSVLEALEFVSRVRDAAAEVSAARGLPTLLADEGGLSPGFRTGREALEMMMAAVDHAGLEPGRDVAFALDVAATSLYDRATGAYQLRREGRVASTDEMIDMVEGWVADFPILSVEDALDEEDWEGWQEITRRLGAHVRLIGDDLFTTNLARLRHGIDSACANGVLVKVNQNGTLTGTLEVVVAAREARYAAVVSARSGETEDDFLADLAVGTGAGQIKVGSVRSSERLAKYNQLLRIAEDATLSFSEYPVAPASPVVPGLA
jgi:enolase